MQVSKDVLFALSQSIVFGLTLRSSAKPLEEQTVIPMIIVENGRRIVKEVTQCVCFDFEIFKYYFWQLKATCVDKSRCLINLASKFARSCFRRFILQLEALSIFA